MFDTTRLALRKEGMFLGSSNNGREPEGEDG
jgi:hypothetical protein